MTNKTIKLILLMVLIVLCMHNVCATAQYQPPIPPADIVTKETYISISLTEPSKVVTIIVSEFDPDHVVREITIHFKSPVTSVAFTIYLLSDMPPEVPDPSGRALTYFIIRAREDILANVEKVITTFSVEKSVLEEAGVDEESISISRFSEGMWEKYSAIKIGEDEKFFYYRVETLGLSHYVILGVLARPYPFPIIALAVIVLVIFIIVTGDLYLSRR